MGHSNNFILSEKLHIFINDVLLKSGVRDDVACYVTEGLIQTSLRGVDSHGVRLLPHYLKALKGDRINPNPKYGFQQTSPSTGMFDADHMNYKRDKDERPLHYVLFGNHCINFL